MPDWEVDSLELRANLTHLIGEVARCAGTREQMTVESAREWQREIMSGLSVPHTRYVGAFRGERGLENVQVQVGRTYGTAAVEVAGELARFEMKLQQLVLELDRSIPVGVEADSDQLGAILDVCGWVHAEWIRIHPFANGNGRSARLWANSIAMRYGLSAFVRLRPRPNSGYAEAGARAMQGDWKPTARFFRLMLDSFLERV